MMNIPQAPPRAVIFDLGDVLFQWSAKTTTSIPAQELKNVLSTPVWHSYERGEITRDSCYEASAGQFSVAASEISEAFVQARASLQPDQAIVSFIRELKKDPPVRVYAMSNIGKEDFEELETKLDWNMFDGVFTSVAAGMRKPEPAFYQHVLDSIGLSGSQVVFVDDKEENVRAARDLGIHGLVFGPSTVNTLRDMVESPVGRGWRWLFENAKNCDSITSDGVAFADNFAKLLIMDILKNQTLIDLSWGSRTTWNFFAGKPALIPGGIFPDDLDTTSLALQVLQPPSTTTVSSILDKMAEFVNDDGTFQTYFTLTKPRVDPIVSANILACFYTFHRGHEFEPTLQLVRRMLVDSACYMQGTHYYSSPDVCLGFIGRLLRSAPDDGHLQTTLGPLLKMRMRERLGVGAGDCSALDLAMRIVTCVQMGVGPCEDERRALLGMQCEDGGWEGGWMYRYGSTGVNIGNRGVTTAMAVAALCLSDCVGVGVDNGVDVDVDVDVDVGEDVALAIQLTAGGSPKSIAKVLQPFACY